MPHPPCTKNWDSSVHAEPVDPSAFQIACASEWSSGFEPQSPLPFLGRQHLPTMPRTKCQTAAVNAEGQLDLSLESATKPTNRGVLPPFHQLPIRFTHLKYRVYAPKITTPMVQSIVKAKIKGKNIRCSFLKS